MKTTLAERLKNARTALGISQKALGEKIGVSQAAIQKIETGKAAQTTRLVELANILNVRPEWLATGEEPMRAPESNIPHESQWGSVASWDSKTALSEDEVEVPFLKDIEFACGDGRIQSEDHNGFMLRFSKSTLRKVGANTDGSGVLCFPVTGDSMEPIIPDGTTVAVDTTNKRIVDGKLYAIAQEGSGNDKLKRIKQIYRKPGGLLVIHSFNRDADEEAYESDVEIIGRVFWYSVLL